MRTPTLSIAGVLLIMSSATFAAETITYSYDARGRLLKVAHAGTVNNGLIADYSFDKADNRLNLTVSGGGTSPSSPGSGSPTNAAECAVVVPANGYYRVIPCGSAA